tara:strand:- start:5214 stop:5357 length:144 start_codon:yes stop_codon:yes gene_type:complete
MKRAIFILCMMATLSTTLISCREKNNAADDVEEAIDDAGDAIEDAVD